MFAHVKNYIYNDKNLQFYFAPTNKPENIICLNSKKKHLLRNKIKLICQNDEIYVYGYEQYNYFKNMLKNTIINLEYDIDKIILHKTGNNLNDNIIDNNINLEYYNKFWRYIDSYSYPPWVTEESVSNVCRIYLNKLNIPYKDDDIEWYKRYLSDEDVINFINTFLIKN